MEQQIINDFILVLLSKEEKDLIQEEAVKKNLSLTEFCLGKILKD